ncbi:hypothetical protein CK203_019703 [Vitis vinifera]|uniref:Uncharacterized protein n=1 Tax=Vitis vinifera TaxID=29760 RepID=A0A438JQT9_VITVI|nr:hypothetical protein CK203_019703 [Vitis vinifera]
MPATSTLKGKEIHKKNHCCRGSSFSQVTCSLFVDQEKRWLAIGTFMKVSGLEAFGFQLEFIGKTGTHLMEIRFNNRGRNKEWVLLPAHGALGGGCDNLGRIEVWMLKVDSRLAKNDWVPPRSILDMMSIKFNGFGSSKRGIALWQAASIALIRIVWWERNARIFEDKARNSEYL